MGYHIPPDHHGPTPAEARKAQEEGIKCATKSCQNRLTPEMARHYAHCPYCVSRLLS